MELDGELTRLPPASPLCRTPTRDATMRRAPRSATESASWSC